MADEKADLKLGPTGTSVSLPMRSGTFGPNVIDITSLLKSHVFTYDPGFMSTAACESKITYIDGDEGILLHRGYPIEQLAQSSDYLEVCYLLLHGELPNQTEKTTFTQEIQEHSMVYEQAQHFFKGFPRDAHPMAMLMGVVSGLSGFYPNLSDLSLYNAAAIRLIAKMPTLAAMCYKHAVGQPFMVPQNNCGYAENFLHMMFTNSYETPKINPILTQAIDRIFLLHADHEQNASTSTVRLAGSTGTHPFAAIGAGIAALWGPAHGGANEAALNMLKEIGDESRIGLFIAKAKDPNDPFRLMGFGHRVYKNFDPRAKVMRNTCHEVLEAVGAHDHPLFKVALKLEQIALEDPYFIERKLYPNVDFYSGLTLSAMGIPTNMFTVIFALARTAGWVSQWIELITSSEFRIGRPRQLYTGPTKRDFVPLNKRK